MLRIYHQGKEVTDWSQIELAQERGRLSGSCSCDCDLIGLPAGEPKPVTLYNVPRECEPPPSIYENGGFGW